MYIDITLSLQKKLLNDGVATSPVLYLNNDCISDDKDLMIYYMATQQLTAGDGINDKIFELSDCTLYFDGNYADNGELTIEYGSTIEFRDELLERLRRLAKNNHLFRLDYYSSSKPPENNYGLIYYRPSSDMYCAFSIDTCIDYMEKVQWWMICTFDDNVDVYKDIEGIITPMVVKIQSKFREWNDKVYDAFIALEIKPHIKFELK